MIKEKELPKAVVNNKLITHKATDLTIMSYDKNVHKLIIPTDITQDQINDIIVLITFRYHDNIIQISGELVEDKIEIILPNEIRSLSGEFYIEIDVNLTDNRQITFARYWGNVVKSDIDSVDLDDAQEFYFELFDDIVQKVADKSEVAVAEIDAHKQSVSDKADTAIAGITDSVTNAKQSALTSITQATSDVTDASTQFIADLADTQSIIETQVTQAQDSLQDVSDTLTAVNDKVATVNDTADNFTADVATKQTDVTSKYNAFDTSVTQANQTIDDILALQPQFQSVLDETTGKDVISAPEVILARGGAQTLGERLDSEKAEVSAQLAEKVGGGKLAEMGDLSQEIKEGMTGGSVAVVGEGAVTKINLANDVKSEIEVPIQNQFINSDFSNLNYGENWSTRMMTGITVIDNVFSFTADGVPSTTTTEQNLYQSFPLVNGQKYYVSAYLYGDTSVELRISSVTIGKVKVPNVWEWVSGSYTSTTTNTRAVGIRDIKTTGWTQTKVKYLVFINLTEMFGVGNEPTKETMDTLMKSFGNRWFNNYADISKVQMTSFRKTNEMERKSLLLNENIQGTTQIVLFNTDGTVKEVQHRNSDNVSVRKDVLTYGTNLITEIRTLDDGQSVTLKYHLDTLKTEVI